MKVKEGQKLPNSKVMIMTKEGPKEIGAEFNWRGWGLRSTRYTMLLHNELIKKLIVEEGKCELTAAEKFLNQI